MGDALAQLWQRFVNVVELNDITKYYLFFALPYSTSVVMGLSVLSLEWSGACVADVVDGAVGGEWWMRERGT